MPVHHLVYFRFKKEACSAEVARQIHADIPRTLLRIPGVTSATFGLDFSRKRTLGFTHLATVKFDSREAFNGWATHPLHAEWGGKWIVPNLDGPPAEAIRKMDIDVDGPAPLTAQHVVFFELDSTSFTASDEAAARKDLAATLMLIPGVTDCAFAKAFVKGLGPDVKFNYALTVSFDSRSALDAYDAHPLHRKWAAAHVIGKIKSIQALDTQTPEHARKARL